MHNKETFAEYLAFVGFTEDGAKKLISHIIDRKASAEEIILLYEYLNGKKSLQEHLKAW